MDAVQTMVRVAYGACAALFVGSIGTWASLGIISVSGLDGDGVLTLILAVAGAVIVWRWSESGGRGKLIGAIVVGGLASAITLYDTVNISNVLEDSAGVGWGLIIALLASLVYTGATIRLWTLPSPQAEPDGG